MTDVGRAARACSFGAQAETYERTRPSYPEAAVRWLVGERPHRVLDLGAGTGKLTRSLAELGHDAVAVEPSTEMLEQLRSGLPGIEALEGSAEQIPLLDGSVDVVVAGQAFHWFEPATALPEIARVLRPSGRLAVVWNMFDETEPLVVRLNELMPPFGNEAEPLEPVRQSPLFGALEEATFSFERRLGHDEFVECIGTSSSVATLPPIKRDEALAAVGRLHDDEAADSSVVLPYVSFAYRATRL